MPHQLLQAERLPLVLQESEREGMPKRVRAAAHPLDLGALAEAGDNEMEPAAGERLAGGPPAA